jgi:ribosomal protein L11 methyltransferase
MNQRRANSLETVSVVVAPGVVDAYVAALEMACSSVGFFKDDATGLWTVEGVKQRGVNEPALAAGLGLAEMAVGAAGALTRRPTEAEGWLARTFEAFPEQHIGRRFAVRGTHVSGPLAPGRHTIILDAALAFGSGEHGSTRGCMRALERVARRRPRRILDLGTGSGILAMAAATLLRRRVLATDIDPWSVRAAARNAAMNELGQHVRVARANGWNSAAPRRSAPYDLVLANILARPLCRMARDLALHLLPEGTAILAGLLDDQARWVLAAHRRQGLRLEFAVKEERWTTLVLRRS